MIDHAYGQPEYASCFCSLNHHLFVCSCLTTSLTEPHHVTSLDTRDRWVPHGLWWALSFLGNHLLLRQRSPCHRKCTPLHHVIEIHEPNLVESKLCPLALTPAVFPCWSKPYYWISKNISFCLPEAQAEGTRHHLALEKLICRGQPFSLAVSRWYCLDGRSLVSSLRFLDLSISLGTIGSHTLPHAWTYCP